MVKDRMADAGALKFLDNVHVPDLMAGKLRLGSLEHYRAAEDATIRDDAEATQSYFQSDTITVETETEAGIALQQKFSRVGIQIGPGRVTFDACTFVRAQRNVPVLLLGRRLW